MTDALGKIAAVIFTAFTLVYLPVLIIALKNENTVQAMAEDTIVEYVDNVRATGVISETEYNTFARRISSIVTFADIQMTHSSIVYIPDGAGGSDMAYRDANKTDIVTVLESGNDYKLKNGDYLIVSVKNTKPTFARRVYSLLFGRGNSDVSIYAIYSGRIGNNVEE